MADVIERLSTCARQLLDAGAEIERLTARIETLEAALKPFAAQIEAIECTTDHKYSDDDTWPVDKDQVVKIGDLRRARQALEQGR